MARTTRSNTTQPRPATRHERADEAGVPSALSHDTRSLLEALPDPAFLVDADDGAVIAANASAGRELGRPGTDLVGEPIGDLVHDASHIVSWRQRVDQALVNGAVTFRARVRGAAGMGRETSVHVAPALGDALRLVLVARTTAAETQPARDDLLDIIRMLPDVVFRCVKHADGKIYWTLNEGRLAQEFHLTTDEIQGKSLDELFPGGASDALKAHFEDAFRGRPTEFVNEIDGRYFKHNPQPVYGPDGRVEAVVGFISEVTKLVQSEKTIQDLNRRLSEHVDDLRAANADLKAFAQMVSHDLRRPLTTVEMQRYILEHALTSDDADARQALATIQRAVRSLDATLNDLLEFSQATQSQLRAEDTDLTAIVHEVLAGLRDHDPERVVQVAVQPSLRAHADPRFLRIALANLIHNAWKFTKDAANARIEIGQVPDAATPTFYVRDNGAGFDPGDAGRIFSLFERGSLAHGVPGNGIGLTTVQRIFRRHGGRAWATGAPGRGATFYFTLPGTGDQERTPR